MEIYICQKKYGFEIAVGIVDDSGGGDMMRVEI